MRRIKRLLTIYTDSQYAQQVLKGIYTYCRNHGRWEHHQELGGWADWEQRTRYTLRSWKPDGIVALASNPQLERLILRTRLPAVNFDAYLPSRLPTVMFDNHAIGRMAARHLLDIGWTHFAFCARTREISPSQRCDGFVEELARAGYRCNVLVDRFVGFQEFNWIENRKQMDRWLISLPKPVAVMCSHDLRGQEVSMACGRLGLRVPDDIALLGVGNHDVLCSMCNPPLSSVDVNVQRIGYEAARLLHAMIRGRKPPSRPVLVPPRRIAARRSTDLVAVDDPEIASAIRFIRDHAHEPISVKDVLREVPISRRSLERRFIQAIGHTPKVEITRLRIALAKELLAQTNLSGSAIALQSGFAGPDKFSGTFRRACGVTPSEYRRSCL